MAPNCDLFTFFESAFFSNTVTCHGGAAIQPKDIGNPRSDDSCSWRINFENPTVTGKLNQILLFETFLQDQFEPNGYGSGAYEANR